MKMGTNDLTVHSSESFLRRSVWRCLPWLLAVTWVILASEAVTGGQDEERAFARTYGYSATVVDDPALPRVLLIGDSISIGYTPEVRRLLAGQANVHRIAANAGPTQRGLENIQAWLGAGGWDVIHFNWGIWDTHVFADGRIRTSLDEYKANLNRLADVMQASGAKLIWATTTPYRRKQHGDLLIREEDNVRYMKAGRQVMAARGVMIDDLYKAVMPRLDELLVEDGVHFTKKGYRFMGELAAASITKALETVSAKGADKRKGPSHAAVTASAARADIPFPKALDNAAVRQEQLDNILENSLVLGNGDINALLYGEGPRLVLRLTKNDVWDSRIDTSMNPPMLKVDIKGKRLIGLGNSPENWHSTPYPQARICADVLLGPAEGSGPSSQSSVLDIARAKAFVQQTPQRQGATVRALAQRNVFLVESSLPASLRPVLVSHLPPAETGIKDGVKWLLQEIPGDLEWSGMTYAVAIAEAGDVKVVSIVSSYEAKDPLSAAVALAQKTAGTEVSALVADHERIWQKFWSASGVTLDEPELEHIWYRNLYLFRCVSKAGVKAVGIFAGMTAPKSSWPFHWLNYNSQQAFWSAYATNHVDLAEPYERMIFQCLPRARWFARQIYDCGGAAFPHVMEMLGLTVTTGDLPAPDKCKSVNGRMGPWPPYSYTIGIAGFAVQNLWLRYKYQPDRTYLAETAYPAIRDVAIFYSDFMDRCEVSPDGKVLLAPSYSPERWNLTEDFRYNRNCAFDIAFVRHTLKAGIEAANILGCDGELADRFKRQLERLPDYPTTKGPEPVVVDVLEAPPITYNIPVPTVPIFPGDQITWFSSEAEKSLFARTLGRIRCNGDNSSMMLSVARARLSMPNTTDWVRAELGARLRPNGTLTLQRQPHRYNNFGHYTEQFAGSMAVSELLLQSVGDIVRVFPAWPMEKTARFADLRAQGGFLVSAACGQGQTQRLEVKATANGVLRLLSPWPEIYVHKPGTSRSSRLKRDAKGMVTVAMQAGDKLAFVPETPQSAARVTP